MLSSKKGLKCFFISLLCLCFFSPAPLLAKVPSEVNTALLDMLNAVSSKNTPNTMAMDTILAYSLSGGHTPETTMSSADLGTDAIFSANLALPLRDIVMYLLDVEIPKDILYPSSVRINSWRPNSPILVDYKAFLDAKYPPEQPLVTHGVEYEETTPDESSGCYYSYDLNRMLILTSYEGRTVLFSVSSMPEKSSVGFKGLIVGNDNDWQYVYSPEIGTNIPMLGWAETYLYQSASVNVFIEQEPGAKQTKMVSFKWVNAGWSGMNVVKKEHVLNGLQRFFNAFKRILESKSRPTPDELKAFYAELNALDDAALRQKLAPLAASFVNRQDEVDGLDDKAIQGVIADNGYANTLTRPQLIHEVAKLYLREKIGLGLPQGYPVKKQEAFKPTLE